MQSVSKTTRNRFKAVAAAALVSTSVIATGVLTTGVMSTAPANAQISIENVAPFSFADLVETVSPAVVSIRVKTRIEQARGPMTNRDGFRMPDLPEGHPFEDFFDQFKEPRGNGDRPRERFGQAVGSGFIISADGFVVTNNHVIEDADEVMVVMENGDEMAAQIIGTDPRTDLALLKIEAASDLQYVEFAENEARVGDWVVAIGNPFGLGGTVTAGIVSARGRDINANAYDDFIQIDAAVNRGNSGGPAFDTTGKVVGVNTAIFSPSGGNVGIAFAIPAATVKQVVFDLMDDGKVTRGFLGVSIQNVSKDIADSVGLEKAHGALVTEPSPDSPAQKAGIKSGDIITSVNGEEIDDARELSRVIAEYAPGTIVEIGVWRNGESLELRVELARLEEEQAIVEPEETPQLDPAEPQHTSTGLTLVPNDSGDGLLIVDIDPESPAIEKGFAPGDVVLEANGEPVNSVAEFEEQLEVVKNDGRSNILVKVARDGVTRFVGLAIE
ncbi:Do family serine endopeptidase [Maritalea mediterranea]|uniref:Probable periplasmic serine endoprotease DegP-like n=1 Tax=Maritalea mediterranea TaxID=2909667 RepID=A0ABS9E515_9HYPH|nr:Do family serine endopeptidase [Maritalea mediterranea]MCF4097960.1 Do family serine endopeptidase [Maritalea mediterranea]